MKEAERLQLVGPGEGPGVHRSQAGIGHQPADHRTTALVADVDERGSSLIETAMATAGGAVARLPDKS